MAQYVHRDRDRRNRSGLVILFLLVSPYFSITHPHATDMKLVAAQGHVFFTYKIVCEGDL